MEFISSNWRDIERYFHNTYVKFPECGERVFYISSVSSREVLAKAVDGEDLQLCLDDNHPYRMEYILPNKAVFQHRLKAYLLRRIPQRQFRRGICEENTQIVDVASGQVVEWNGAMLDSYTNKPAYFSMQEALFGKNKLQSLALGRRLSYVKATKSLHMDSITIGSFNREDSVFTILSKFQRETSHLFLNLKPTVKVEYV